MADRIVVIDYSFSFSVKKAVKLYVAIFFSVKKKEETVIPSWTIQCGLYHRPRPQGFSLKWVGRPPHPFFKGKALGTRLLYHESLL